MACLQPSAVETFRVAWAGNHELVPMLLNYGAEAQIGHCVADTPLHHGARLSNLKMVERSSCPRSNTHPAAEDKQGHRQMSLLR